MNKEFFIRVVEVLNKVEQNSRETAYLNNFTDAYNELRKLAYSMATSAEDYTEMIADLDEQLDKMINKKLIAQYGEDVIRYTHYIDATKDEIPNKYIRYKIFGFWYNLAVRYSLVDINNEDDMINHMTFTYHTFLSILERMPSTERPVTDRDIAISQNFTNMRVWDK